MAWHSPARSGRFSFPRLAGVALVFGALCAALAASIVLNVVLIAGRSDSTAPQASTPRASAPTATAAAGSLAVVTPVALPIGATMGLGTVKMTVDRVFTIPGPAGRTLVGIEGTMENGGLERAAITAAQQFKVLDSAGNSYAMSIDAMHRARELGLSKRQEWSADMAPGQVFKGFIAFDLPSDCRGMTFEVTGLSREARWILDPACEGEPASPASSASS